MPMSGSNELHVVVGTGAVGSAVIRVLAHRGARVRAVNRRGAASVPEGVEVMGGDATDHDSVIACCRGATAVYHCANAPYTEWPAKFPPIMHGIIVGVEAAEAKLVFADNLYGYGPVTGPITEDLPYDATGPKGHTRAHVAETLMEAHAMGKVRATIGRSSDFFGPGVLQSHMGERVFQPVLAGKPASLLGRLDVPHTYTFIDDFAAGLVTLGEREEALGEAWHIPSGETMTTGQFLAIVFRVAGVNPSARTLPKLMLSILARFNPVLRELKETLYQLEQPFVMDHGKYERAFGASPTPHDEAIRRTIEWYRDLSGEREQPRSG
jgi:nucleoside-diphosphate-sugar epimerase